MTTNPERHVQTDPDKIEPRPVYTDCGAWGVAVVWQPFPPDVRAALGAEIEPTTRAQEVKDAMGYWRAVEPGDDWRGIYQCTHCGSTARIRLNCGGSPRGHGRVSRWDADERKANSNAA